MIDRTLALCAAVAFGLVTAASAARADWSGYYMGFNAGLNQAEIDSERTISGNTYFAASSVLEVEGASDVEIEEDGFAGGGQFGVNWDAGVMVFGLEFDAQGYGNDATSSATVDYSCCPGPPQTTFTTTTSLEQTWGGTARLRAGIGTDWLLVYGTGGFAFADVEFTQTFSDTFAPIALQTITNSAYQTGWAGGGGFELKLEHDASFRVEYLYIDLGEITAVGPIGTGPTTSNGRADITNHFIRAGVNFRLD